MLSANEYTATVVGRLYDFLNRHAPWHTALWGIGTALSLDEVIEYSDLTRLGSFPNKEGLNYVCRVRLEKCRGRPRSLPTEPSQRARSCARSDQSRRRGRG